MILAITGLNGRFLYNCHTDIESVNWILLGLTPATPQYKERPWRIDTHEIAIHSGGRGGPKKAKREWW